jgi:hypothetical protein
VVDSTLGIDLASQAENTAVCLLEWHADRVEVRYLVRAGDGLGPLSDDRLLELMVGGLGGPPTKIGIDAPLGWPLAFVRAVADLDAWPLLEEVAPVDLVRRATDRWIHEQTGKTPLSVSTDRIAYPAMRAVRLLRRYRAAMGLAIDRTGQTGPVAEVYPDTAVTRFGLRPDASPRLSYKGPGGAEVRAVMLDRLSELAPWLALSTSQLRDCVTSDDHFDALIAALLTRSVQLELTSAPPAELADAAAVEGWIHLPEPGGLAHLRPPRA